MTTSTLLFVHGTGVRSVSFSETLEQIESKVIEFKLPCVVDSCPWGIPLGIDFAGLSLPEPPARSEDEATQELRWEYLQVDPLFDLRLWCTPAAEPTERYGEDIHAAEDFWDDNISHYTDDYPKRVELIALLKRNGLESFFLPAWNKVTILGSPREAFAAAQSDTPAISRVFAEAMVAQMMHDAAAADPPVALPPLQGIKIVDLLLLEWNQKTKGLKDLWLKYFGKATRSFVRPLRAGASHAIAPAIGDILHYQGVGEELRKLIGNKIGSITGDVFLLAHSLGGIACFEMMVEARSGGKQELEQVKGLITAGSQAPLLYEFGALQTIKNGTPLPKAFPPWLNIYDENDLLSYRADRLFGAGRDKQVDCMLPPLQAHSAYWKLDATWNAIAGFMKTNA